MRAISVRQPWASRIASGEKSLEVRSWRIAPGPILVCSSAAPDRKRGRPWLGGDEPLGVAVCVVDVVAVRDGRAEDTATALVDPTGYLVWELAAPRAVEHFPIKGRLGVFSVDDSLIRYAAISLSA